ncbi:RHO1 GDP-GTP exchange protein 2 [Ceratobasidium sp. 414]|nr:RHO1 GDP-GTP exchange protein 2 [Ceratobasidium sp. 414]
MMRMERISSHATFFTVGRCLNRTLLCVVEGSSISSTVKVLEPINQNTRRKSTFERLLHGGNDSFKVYKEFYLPTEIFSVHFLKTKLCMACTTGFEVVDIETLNTQLVLNPADASLNFVQSANLRVGEFAEFAFYVDKNGCRSRSVTIYWEGFPTAFALHYPYVMAFDPTFVEIRHVEDGTPVQVIQGKDIRCLFAENQPSTTNSSSTRSTCFRDPRAKFNDRRSQDSRVTSDHTPYTARPEILPDRPWRSKIILLSDNQVVEIERTGLLPRAPVASTPGT